MRARSVTSEPRPRTDRRWIALVALLGAAPSVAWALRHPALLHDDWSYASWVHFRGVWKTIYQVGTHTNGRPLQAVFFGITYGLFGAHPVPHALLLGALNGVAAALLYCVVRRFGDHRLGLLAALVWTALPNRSSSHYWFSAAPIVLAVCLLLAGVLALSNGRRGWAVVALVAGVLTYEAVGVLSVVAIAAWAWRGGRRRAVPAVAMTVPLAASAAWLWEHSPKAGGVRPLADAGRWISTQYGAGIFRSPVATALGSAALLAVVALAAARTVAPGFAATRLDRAVLIGLAVSVGGLLPFLAIGFPVTTDGFFDRGNVVADLGTAVMLAAALALVLEHLPAIARHATAAAVVLGLAWPGVASLSTYVAAADAGRHLEADLAADVPQRDVGPLVIGPPLSHNGGVAELVTSWDTSAYLELARHDPVIEARMACTAADFLTARESDSYDRITRVLVMRNQSTTFGSAACHAGGL